MEDFPAGFPFVVDCPAGDDETLFVLWGRDRSVGAVCADQHGENRFELRICYQHELKEIVISFEQSTHITAELDDVVDGLVETISSFLGVEVEEDEGEGHTDYVFSVAPEASFLDAITTMEHLAYFMRGFLSANYTWVTSAQPPAP